MNVIESIEECRHLVRALKSDGKRVGFVPTMGALHEGHLALVKASLDECDATVVSIFVNPTQFNDPKDFEGYPRVMEDDLAACRAAGVDVVWTSCL